MDLRRGQWDRWGATGHDPAGDGREHRGLAARAGAQIEPRAREGPGRRRRRAGQRGVGQGQGGELAGLVLDEGATLGHRRYRRGVAAVQDDAERGPARRLRRFGRALADELLRVGQAREGGEGDPGPDVAGGQGSSGFGQAASRLLAERGAERLDDPARVAAGRGQVADRVGGPVGGDNLEPFGLGPGADAAQHRVDEPGGAHARHILGQVHGRGDRGVAGHPGGQQLVGAQPQYLADRRIDVTR